MNPENIKIGETYYTPAKVIDIGQHGNPLVSVLNRDTYCFPDDLHPITPSEPPTLVGPSPKYDPCRKFRKGDKVRLIKWNGRNPFDTHHGLKLNPGEVHIVLDDEYARNEVYIGMSAADEEQSVVHSCNLELITPVEEMGPYSVRHNAVHAAWSIYGPFDLSAVNYFYGERYPYTKETARAAAEAERDRLNAEHRKELQ